MRVSSRGFLRVFLRVFQRVFFRKRWNMQLKFVPSRSIFLSLSFRFSLYISSCVFGTPKHVSARFPFYFWLSVLANLFHLRPSNFYSESLQIVVGLSRCIFLSRLLNSGSFFPGSSPRLVLVLAGPTSFRLRPCSLLPLSHRSLLPPQSRTTQHPHLSSILQKSPALLQSPFPTSPAGGRPSYIGINYIHNNKTCEQTKHRSYT